MTRRAARRGTRLAAAVATTVTLAGCAHTASTSPRTDGPVPRAVEAARYAPVTTLSPSCAPSGHPFRPRTVALPGTTRPLPVIAPPRDAGNVPGVPPLTAEGKWEFAWDASIAPGAPAGNVLLNAHTWPDGSALGNRLLGRLEKGDRIVVRGAGRKLCYRVTERVEVPAAQGLPRYYATDGPPQLAIVVCSGRRLGPGDWEDRTIWFASPQA